MFEHFSDNARRILILAQEEGQHLHDRSIAPEHLLLGMLREGEGIATKGLSGTGADYDRAREIIEEDHGQHAHWRSDRQPFSEATIRIIERSVRISWAQADGGIDTEHLLVALLAEEDERIEAVLAGLDITPEEVVQRVNTLLALARRW